MTSCSVQRRVQTEWARLHAPSETSTDRPPRTAPKLVTDSLSLPSGPHTPLEPQSRFGDKPVKFQVVFPQNGTAVLKVEWFSDTCSVRSVTWRRLRLVLCRETPVFFCLGKILEQKKSTRYIRALWWFHRHEGDNLCVLLCCILDSDCMLLLLLL